MYGNSSRAILFCDTPKLMWLFTFFYGWCHHAHHFIGKRPVGWKQAIDSKFRKVFLTHVLFVDNKTAQKLDGNLINVTIPNNYFTSSSLHCTNLTYTNTQSKQLESNLIRWAYLNEIIHRHWMLMFLSHWLLTWEAYHCQPQWWWLSFCAEFTY